MKKKHFILPLLLIGIAVWWLLHRSTTTQTMRNEDASETNELHVPSNTLEKKQHLSTKPANAITPKELEPQEQREKRQAETEERSLNEWRAPINFYGKVVDENEQPVAGAQIAFGWNDLSPTDGHSTAQTSSDSTGQFSLRNKTGKLLSVSITKEGYYTAKPAKQYFEYGDRYERFVPNSNAPVIFHLRKHGNIEPLIVIDYPGFAKIAQLRRNGEPVELDLINSKKTSTGHGHLKLEFWGDPIDRKTTLFNWKCRISIPNGGIMETDEEFNFEAPVKGYSDFLEIEGSPEKWRAEVRSKYFIQLSDGKYGRIEFHLIARNGVFDVQSFINPSGSRNLEYNESKQSK